MHTSRTCTGSTRGRGAPGCMLHLRGLRSNPNAIGARVTVQRRRRAGARSAGRRQLLLAERFAGAPRARRPRPRRPHRRALAERPGGAVARPRPSTICTLRKALVRRAGADSRLRAHFADGGFRLARRGARVHCALVRGCRERDSRPRPTTASSGRDASSMPAARRRLSISRSASPGDREAEGARRSAGRCRAGLGLRTTTSATAPAPSPSWSARVERLAEGRERKHAAEVLGGAELPRAEPRSLTAPRRTRHGLGSRLRSRTCSRRLPCRPGSPTRHARRSPRRLVSTNRCRGLRRGGK